MALYRIGNMYLNETETNAFFNMVTITISFGVGLIFGLVSTSYGLEHLEFSRNTNIAISLIWSLVSGMLFVKGRRMLFLVFYLTLATLFSGDFSLSFDLDYSIYLPLSFRLENPN